jgi:hypothetical protein
MAIDKPVKPGLSREPIDGDVRFDPDDSRPIYIGLHIFRGADTASTDWTIFRFTYTTATASDITQIEKRVLSWTGRAVGW